MNTMQVIKGYKVRIYPNKEQSRVFLKTIGSCRFVYNHFLEEKKKHYFEGKKSLTYGAASRQLTELRKETDWLSQMQFQPLQQSLRALDVSYSRFFRKQARFPRFKSKKDVRQSFRKVTGWRIKENKIYIMDGVSVRFRGTFPKKREGTLTVSRESDGKWYCSTFAKAEVKTPKRYTKPIGIDLGLKNIIVTSQGERYDMPKEYVPKIEHRSMSRKKKGSNGWNKSKLILMRSYKKVANIRKNVLHHISKAITSKNHAAIVVEDLAVKNMMQNHRLARAIAHVSWGELLRQLKYKQEWRGGKFITIDRFFPSSKMCSKCHFIMQSLPLSVRQWICPNCKEDHDRDKNAAKNILSQAGEQLGAEGGEGKRKLRSALRITRPLKLGYGQG